MSKRLEYNVEEVIMGLIQKSSLIGSLPVVHNREDIASFDECIVVKAESRRKMLEAFKGYEIDVEVIYRNIKSDAKREEAIAREILVSVLNPKSSSSGISKFSDFHILEDCTTDRSSNKNLVRRHVTFTVLAKEK